MVPIGKSIRKHILTLYLMFGIIGENDPINKVDFNMNEEFGSSWIVELIQVSIPF